MDVVFLGPGYPGEMPLFTRGLAEVGATGHRRRRPARRRAARDRPAGAGRLRPDRLVGRRGRRHVAPSSTAVRGRNVDLVETLWEPTVLLAARLREAIGAPGMTRRADARRSATRGG